MRKIFKSHDGLDINYEILRKDPKLPFLVYLHGVGGNMTVWSNIINVHKEKFNILCLDLRGHGLSSTPEDIKYYKLENFVKDLKSILKKEKIDNYSFIGHSLGGSLAIVYCTEFKKLRPQSMVLIQSTYEYPYKKYNELNANFLICYILRKGVEYNIITNRYFPKIPRLDFTRIAKENSLFQIYEEIYYTPIRTIFHCLDNANEYSINKGRAMASTLKSINFPVFVIACREDDVIPMRFSEDIAVLVKNLKKKVFKKASHRLPLENWQELSKDISLFLSQNHFKI